MVKTVSDLSMIVECLTVDLSLNDVKDLVRQAMMVDPNLRGVRVKRDEEGVYAQVMYKGVKPDVARALGLAIEQTPSVMAEMDKLDVIIMSHRETMGYFMAFASEILEYHGFRDVTISGLGTDDVKASIGESFDGSVRPSLQKDIEAFFVWYVLHNSYQRGYVLDYSKLRSYNKDAKSIRIGISGGR